jgi:hypothetical protein
LDIVVDCYIIIIIIIIIIEILLLYIVGRKHSQLEVCMFTGQSNYELIWRVFSYNLCGGDLAVISFGLPMMTLPILLCGDCAR